MFFLEKLGHFQTSLLILVSLISADLNEDYTFSIMEEVDKGTFVGVLKRFTTLNDRYEEYILMDDKYFHVNKSTGILTTQQRIDHESLCQDKSLFINSKCTLLLSVIRQNTQDPTRTEYLDVLVKIVDINDNIPAWDKSEITLEISEHTSVGKLFHLPLAMDPDSDPENSMTRYEFKDLNYFTHDQIPPFQLEKRYEQAYKRVTGIDLRVDQDIDREQTELFNYQILAIDDGFISNGNRISKTGTLNLIINITDINDNHPKFDMPLKTINLPEDAKVNTEIYQCLAEDIDKDSNLEFSFSQAMRNTETSLFRIDPLTGSIYLEQQLDYETAPLIKLPQPKDSPYQETLPKPGYRLQLVVSDGKNIDEQSLYVFLENVNDNPPSIKVQSHLKIDKEANDLVISEATMPGTILATLFVEDADEKYSKNMNVKCTMTNEYFSLDQIPNKKIFSLKLVAALDREEKATHRIIIKCSDNEENVSKETSIIINVILRDENDSEPLFEKAFYQGSIEENKNNGVKIMQVRATDRDTTNNSVIKYSLESNYAHNFMNEIQIETFISIDENSGEISSETIFDRESLADFNFTVLANDSKHTTRANVSIKILDVNDCRPEFEQTTYEFFLRENESPNHLIGQVLAHDLDAEQRNNIVKYSLASSTTDEYKIDNDYFNVNSDGRIYTKFKEFDRETIPIFAFNVEAKDNGNPQLSAIAHVIIRLEDVNDNAPQWVFPISLKNSKAVMNISQYTPVGKSVASIRATDLDEGYNGQVIYSITHGDESDYFELNRHRGDLILIKSLDPKQHSKNESIKVPKTFRIFLRAEDQGDPILKNETVLELRVRSDLEYVHESQLSPLASPKMNGIFGLDRDFVIMISMITATLIISIILVMAIGILRCRQFVFDGTRHLEQMNNVGLLYEGDASQRYTYENQYKDEYKKNFHDSTLPGNLKLYQSGDNTEKSNNYTILRSVNEREADYLTIIKNPNDTFHSQTRPQNEFINGTMKMNKQIPYRNEIRSINVPDLINYNGRNVITNDLNTFNTLDGTGKQRQGIQALTNNDPKKFFQENFQASSLI